MSKTEIDPNQDGRTESGPEIQPTRRRGRGWVILILAAFAVAIFAGIVELATQEPAEEELVRLEGVGESQRIFGGLRQHEDRIGDPAAPVTIQLFTDMQCEPCADHFLDVIPGLVDRQVRSGDVQVHYRHYSFGPTTVGQSFFGAEAAAVQSYLWQYVYVFFASQAEAERLGIDAAFLRNVAASLQEMDILLWEEDYLAAAEPDSEVMERLASQEQIARGLGLRAQPSVVINGPGGTETLQDTPSLDEIEAAIERIS